MMSDAKLIKFKWIGALLRDDEVGKLDHNIDCSGKIVMLLLFSTQLSGVVIQQ